MGDHDRRSISYPFKHRRNVLTLGMFQAYCTLRWRDDADIYVDAIKRSMAASELSIQRRTLLVIAQERSQPRLNDWHGLIDELEIFNRALTTRDRCYFQRRNCGKCKPIQPTAAFSGKSTAEQEPSILI